MLDLFIIALIQFTTITGDAPATRIGGSGWENDATSTQIGGSGWENDATSKIGGSGWEND